MSLYLVFVICVTHSIIPWSGQPTFHIFRATVSLQYFWQYDLAITETHSHTTGLQLVGRYISANPSPPSDPRTLTLTLILILCSLSLIQNPYLPT